MSTPAKAPAAKVDRDWGSPTHWTDFHRKPITPPPAKFVVYKKVTAPVPAVGNRTIPAGSYECNVSKLASDAIGKPADDPRKAEMRTWLKKYWKADYQHAIGTYDDAWFFSHTVSQQNKADNPQNPFPDPGEAKPGLGPGLDLGGFLEKLAVLFTAEFWLRVGEFLLGAILVGVGISHLSTDAGNAIKSVPGYGKLVGKVLPK